MIEFSDTFDIKKTDEYTLSIRFTPSGFCFAVTDIEKIVRYFALYDEPFNHNNEILKKPFKNVYFCCDSNNYTLLPQSVFHLDLQEKYWNLNFGQLPLGERLSHDIIRLTDVVNLYSCSLCQKELDEIKVSNPSLQVVHRQSILLCLAVMQSKQFSSQQVYLHLMSGRFDFLYLERGRIVLANTHAYHNVDEFLYFVLNTFDQLKLDPYETQVLIGGKSSEERKSLEAYIKNVREESFLPKGLSNKFSDECVKEQYVLLNLPFAVNN